MDIIGGLIRDILVVLMLLTLWKKIEDRVYSVFYRRPLRNYLRVLVKLYFLLTWVCLAVWYVAVVHGCGRYPPGPYLEAFCLQPHYSRGDGMPQYLELWNASNEHWNASNEDSSLRFSYDTKTILTSHIAIDIARIALQQQAFRLKDRAPEMISTDDLSSSLDQVIDMVTDLGPQLDAFSLKFFVEKDTMTYTFRTFIEAYAMTITLSGYEHLTLPSILLFPGFHLMRIINQCSLWSWLPEPKLYSVQVRAEIQFQKAKLIDELEAALDRVDASLPPIQLFQDSSSQIQCLETAIDKVTIHQQSIGQMIDRSDPSFWRWIRKSEETVKLEEYYRLGERVRGLLFEIIRIVEEYEMCSKQLRSSLQLFRQTFEERPVSKFSARTSLEVPPALLAHVQNVSLLSRGRSSRVHEDGDIRVVTQIASRSRASLYNLDSIDDTRLSSLRSEVAQACNAGYYHMMGSKDLFWICMIFHSGTVRSALDDDPLSDFPTSWAVLREKIIRRLEQRMRM